jgi:signal transduction histidine kinase
MPGVPRSLVMGRAARLNLALGTILGLGAPLGFFAVRALLRPRRWRKDLRREAAAYLYMALATPLAFGVFGRALGRKEEELRTTHREIERLREEFAAVVAHDLRNPLNNILLEVDLLLRHAEGGSVRVPVEALARLRRGAVRLNEMVADLLDAARIEAARLRVNPLPTPLPEAIRALIDRITPALGDHPVELEVDGPLPPALVDPMRLDQIVTNLLDNAAKYSAEGSTIEVRLTPADGGVALSVEDRGQGIAPDDLPRLFDRFYQTKRARQKKVGLGLGLYITKGLLEAHGGRIGVSSTVGCGSCFRIWLPAAR